MVRSRKATEAKAMAGTGPAFRASRESLVVAGRRLKLALTDPVNEAVLRDTFRDAVVALEFHIDSLRAHGGLADRIATSEPRLLNDVQRLDASLSDLLTGFWEAQKELGPVQAESRARLTDLAAELDLVAERETALLYEAEVHLGGLD